MNNALSEVALQDEFEFGVSCALVTDLTNESEDVLIQYENDAPEDISLLQ